MLRNSRHYRIALAFCVVAAYGLLRAASLGIAQAPASAAVSRKSILIDRAPSRVIQDTKSSFSAVTVDVARDEIILQDESLEQIAVYNRLDNTPPQAAMTEPKRVIGGPKTNIAMNCGIYVDPVSGDIYSVNGDTNNWMSVFSREAKGDVAANRSLRTPHRAFGVTVDEEAQELFLTINHAPAVVVYRKNAQQYEPPLRILEGDRTGLGDVQGITLDTKNQVMYVANRGATARNMNNVGWARALQGLEAGAAKWDIPPQDTAWKNFVPGSGSFAAPSITAYPLKASGDTAPLRVIQGPLTKLNWPAHIALDTERQEIYATNTLTDEILVFRAGDTGNVAPVRILKGSRTGLKNPHGVHVDIKNDEIVVANFGNHAATVYRRSAAGDTPPIRTIRAAPPNTPAVMFGNIGALAYDTKRDELIVPN